ncbi:MAG: NAD(P)-binding protein [Rickettsiales bacterium]|nr:NAD(P)-binding protein [Rickettsiales bacterium]
MTKTRIAIIGAGIAGLHLANKLHPGAELCVFEKARGVSGRLSTRYADPFQFDHGAQYFTARSAAFQAFLAPFIADTTVKEWTPRITTLAKGERPYKRDWFEPHYVASPRMNRLCQRMAEGLDIRLPFEIRTLQREHGAWIAHDSTGGMHGPFDWVISTAPAPQSSQLMPSSFSGHEALARVRMSGCYSVLIGMDAPLPWSWEVAVVKDSPLAWIAANHSKPERASKATSLLLQSTNEWAEEHINADVPAMQTLLLAELQSLTGFDASDAPYLTTHRWRYAAVEEAAGEPYLLDTSLQLAVCGDGCLGGRVEAAWQSADALADTLRRSL